jgi:hypothetical protein
LVDVGAQPGATRAGSYRRGRKFVRFGSHTQ